MVGISISFGKKCRKLHISSPAYNKPAKPDVSIPICHDLLGTTVNAGSEVSPRHDPVYAVVGISFTHDIAAIALILLLT